MSRQNNLLDGLFSMSSGGGGGSDLPLTVVDGKLCITFEEVTTNEYN